MVMKIKRALFAMLLLSALLMMPVSVEAATRKKTGTTKKNVADTKEINLSEPVVDVETIAKEAKSQSEAVKEVKKKKDISEMASRKLEKMKALQSMNSNGLINFTVNEYK